MDTSQLISAALGAIKKRDFVTARNLLKKAVNQDPRSEAGWVLLGTCLEQDQQKIYCFKKALEINPANQTAQRLLGPLEDKHKEPPLSTPRQTFEDDPEPPTDTNKKNKRNRAIFTISLLLGLMLIGAVFNMRISSSKMPPKIIFQAAKAVESVLSGDIFTIQFVPRTSKSSTPGAEIEGAIAHTPVSDELPESKLERYELIEPKRREARSLFEAEKYAEAALLWDEILSIVPDYALGYVNRATCYYFLGKFDQHMLYETREYYDRAYADLDQALQLGLEIGQVYDIQHSLFGSRGNLEEYRIFRDQWYVMSLDAHLVAIGKGLRSDWGNRVVGGELVDIGRCQEALVFFEKLEDATDPTGKSISGIYYSLAQAYLCLNDYQQALHYIDRSLEVSPSAARENLRARILVNAGLLEEALTYYNEDIEAEPNYGGRRYTIRAAIYYDLGEPEKALQSIYEGYGHSWGTMGLRSYVLGKIAIDKGDNQEGLSHLLDGEATMVQWDMPRYYNDALAEIERLGGTPLYPTATPTPGPSPTPIEPIPDHLFFTPTPPADQIKFSSVTYSGIGTRLFDTDGADNFKFHPDSIIQISGISSLTLYLDIDQDMDQVDLRYQCIPKNGTWGITTPLNYTDLVAGENQISDPEECVPENGVLYIAIINMGETNVLVNDLKLKLVAIDENGTEVTFGSP